MSYNLYIYGNYFFDSPLVYEISNYSIFLTKNEFPHLYSTQNRSEAKRTNVTGFTHSFTSDRPKYIHSYHPFRVFHSQNVPSWNGWVLQPIQFPFFANCSPPTTSKIFCSGLLWSYLNRNFGGNAILWARICSNQTIFARWKTFFRFNSRFLRTRIMQRSWNDYRNMGMERICGAPFFKN